jgi:hypothetical protein
MPSKRGLKGTGSVKRSEFDALRAVVQRNGVIADRNRVEHEIEFKRIAEIQLKLDRLDAIIKRLVSA